jgi:hypothetical protein
MNVQEVIEVTRFTQHICSKGECTRRELLFDVIPVLPGESACVRTSKERRESFFFGKILAPASRLRRPEEPE